MEKKEKVHGDTLGIIAAIIGTGIMISGAILWTGGQGNDEEHYYEILRLRGELIKMETMLDSAMKTLQHERLLHFGEVVSGDGVR